MSADDIPLVIPIPLSILKKHRSPPHLVEAQAKYGGIPVPVTPVLLEYVLSVTDNLICATPEVDAFVDAVYRATIVAPVKASEQGAEQTEFRPLHATLEKLLQAHTENLCKHLDQSLSQKVTRAGCSICPPSVAKDISGATTKPWSSSTLAVPKEDKQPLPAETVSVPKPATSNNFFSFKFTQPTTTSPTSPAPKVGPSDTASKPPPSLFSKLQPFNFGASGVDENKSQVKDSAKTGSAANEGAGNHLGLIMTKDHAKETHLTKNANNVASKPESADEKVLTWRNSIANEPLSPAKPDSSEVEGPLNPPSNGNTSAKAKRVFFPDLPLSTRVPPAKDIFGLIPQVGTSTDEKVKADKFKISPQLD